MNKENNYQNNREEDIEKAKEFVMHNCYEDVENEGNFHSEVCPFAFKSYLKYPFFSSKKGSEYNIYYYWHLDRNGKRGPYKSDDLDLVKNNEKYIKVINGNTKYDDLMNIDGINLKNIGFRRQIATMKGCFFSKDSKIEGKKIGDPDVNSINLDLSGDVITSIKTSLNKLLKFLDDVEVSDKEVEQLQLCKFNSKNSLFNRKIINITDELKQSVKKFCLAVGTIGNRIPIPEHTNPGGKDCDNYYYKFKSQYMDLFNIKTMDVSKEQSIIRLFWLFYEKGHRYDQNPESWKCFVEDFCLQDYFVEDNYYELIKPCNEHKFNEITGYPSDDAGIDDWIDWFNCNTCLILKRGARIYSKGNEKIRKKLASELISDERFDLDV